MTVMNLWKFLSYKPSPSVKEIDPLILELGTVAMQLGVKDAEQLEQIVKAYYLYETRLWKISAAVQHVQKEFGWSQT